MIIFLKGNFLDYPRIQPLAKAHRLFFKIKYNFVCRSPKRAYLCTRFLLLKGNLKSLKKNNFSKKIAG